LDSYVENKESGERIERGRVYKREKRRQRG